MTHKEELEKERIKFLRAEIRERMKFIALIEADEARERLLKRGRRALRDPLRDLREASHFFSALSAQSVRHNKEK